MTHREHLAHLYYAFDCAGKCVPCRWQTLRDDLKEKWLKIADDKLAKWIVGEEAARKAREVDHNPRAFFC